MHANEITLQVVSLRSAYHYKEELLYNLCMALMGYNQLSPREYR